MWDVVRAWLFPVWCIGCGADGTGLCAPCAAAVFAPETHVANGVAVRAAAEYGGVLRAAILALKRGERAYLDPLAALLTPLVPPGTAVVPVPTTRRRAAERGFDQARALARRVVAARGGTCADVLRKRGPAQHGSARARRLAAAARYELRRDVEVPAAAWLLDDVVTTGATLAGAAAALTAAGCCVSGAVVLARTPLGRETSRRDGRLAGA